MLWQYNLAKKRYIYTSLPSVPAGIMASMPWARWWKACCCWQSIFGPTCSGKITHLHQLWMGLWVLLRQARKRQYGDISWTIIAIMCWKSAFIASRQPSEWKVEEDELLSVCSAVGFCFSHNQIVMCKKNPSMGDVIPFRKEVSFLFVSLGYLGQVKGLFHSTVMQKIPTCYYIVSRPL